jgi:hypothetical protein
MELNRSAGALALEQASTSLAAGALELHPAQLFG